MTGTERKQLFELTGATNDPSKCMKDSNIVCRVELGDLEHQWSLEIRRRDFES